VGRWFQISVREALLATAVLACLVEMWAPRRELLAVRETGRDFDIALMGEGYFALTHDPGDFYYTRRGRFVVDDDRCVVLDTGATRHEDQWFLDPAICVPEEAASVRISSTGLVTCLIPNTGKRVALGQIQISRFPNPRGLREVEPGIFERTAATGQATDIALSQEDRDVIKQGWLDATTANANMKPRWRWSHVVAVALGGLVILKWIRVRNAPVDSTSEG
jgi:flagellar basal body rod protein FlgG